MPEENGSASNGVFVSSEFDIFVHKPIQTSVLETIYSLQTPRTRRSERLGIWGTRRK